MRVNKVNTAGASAKNLKTNFSKHKEVNFELHPIMFDVE